MRKYLLLSLVLFFSATVTAHIDSTIGITAPKNIGRDYAALAAYLCFDVAGEEAKVNAVYNWITHNISYDVKALKKFPKYHPDKIERTLKNQKAVCEGYAMTFTEICRAAGLKAVNVEGYAKDWIFDNGDQLYIPRHMWSAVMVNGQWQLFDPTWGAGIITQSPGWLRRQRNKLSKNKVMYSKKLKFKYKYDTQYFMQDPEAFRLKHLPSDPLWQLTDTLMPIQVFEAGDSAIMLFNEKYSKPRQNDPKLAQISSFDERQKTFEFADRAYSYNPRYSAILAMKQSSRAVSLLEKAFTDTTVQNGDLMIKDAAVTLRKSQDYIKEQRKSIPEEYSKLKKKNKTKGQGMKQYVREIKTDDKRLMSECRKYANSANNKYNRIRKKMGEAEKRKQSVYAGRIDDIPTSTIQKKNGAPELAALKDSISRRDARIMDVQKQIETLITQIQQKQTESGAHLDSLGKSITFEDSMLVQEAVARLNMHDSYDDEVVKFSSQFKHRKYKITDTLEKNYFISFDTIAAMHDKLQKTGLDQLDLHKKNIADMEQYKKWNSADSSLAERYDNAIQRYHESIDAYNKDLSAYANYVKVNKKLFTGLAALSKRQIRIAEYMEKAEARRKVLEERTIAKKQAFDMKENERQRQQLRELTGKVEKLAAQLN